MAAIHAAGSLHQYLRWGVYTFISTGAYSQNSKTAAKALWLKVFSYKAHLRWSHRLLKSPKENHKLYNGRNGSFRVWRKVNRNCGNNMNTLSKLRESHCKINSRVAT